MRNAKAGNWLVTGLTALALAGMAQAQQGLPAAQQANGTEYVTGGFGDDAARAFKQAESSYPLTLVFAEDAGGGSRPYIAEVQVVVKDADGQHVLEVPSAGPYLLLKLQPGTYQVEASYMGKSQIQEVRVSEGQPSRHVLTWASR